MQIESDGAIASRYHEATMPHVEIVASLIAFFALTAAWFVVPAGARVHLELTAETSEPVAAAA